MVDTAIEDRISSLERRLAELEATLPALASAEIVPTGTHFSWD